MTTLLQDFGFLINWKRSLVALSQDLLFIGACFQMDLGGGGVLWGQKSIVLVFAPICPLSFVPRPRLGFAVSRCLLLWLWFLGEVAPLSTCSPSAGALGSAVPVVQGYDSFDPSDPSGSPVAARPRSSGQGFLFDSSACPVSHDRCQWEGLGCYSEGGLGSGPVGPAGGASDFQLEGIGGCPAGFLIFFIPC